MSFVIFTILFLVFIVNIDITNKLDKEKGVKYENKTSEHSLDFF